MNVSKKDNLFFLENGYLHLKGILPRKEILKTLDKFIKNNRESLINRNNIRVEGVYHKVKLAYNIIKNQKIKKIVKSLIVCKKLMGVQSTYLATPPKSCGMLAHQDDFFLKSGINNTMNVWVPLTNIDKKKAPLTVYEKSHIEGIKPMINMGINLKRNRSKSYLKKFKKKIINCKIGDVVFLSNNIFHGGAKNTSKSYRHILAFTYLKSNKKFNRGKVAKRKKFLV